MTTYPNLQKWTRPENYAGATWEGYYSAGVGQSRDSDDIEESNFAAMWKALQAVNSEAEIIRESHWAVGWVEWIAIPPSDTAGLTVANELKGKLEDYPILDDDDVSEREMNTANTVWKDCYSAKDRIAYMREHRNQFEFQSFADLLGCARGSYFAGYASELIY
jgi:hypothetical protein